MFGNFKEIFQKLVRPLVCSSMFEATGCGMSVTSRKVFILGVQFKRPTPFNSKSALHQRGLLERTALLKLPSTNKFIFLFKALLILFRMITVTPVWISQLHSKSTYVSLITQERP